MKLIAELEQSGAIIGVTDDRGKYICMDEAALDAVVAYIEHRGRASISAIAKEASSAIDLFHSFDGFACRREEACS